MHGVRSRTRQAGSGRVTVSLALCALVASSGCTRWQMRTAPVTVAIEEVGDRRARLTLADGRHVRMAAPRMAGDSVVGYEAPGENGTRRAVAVSEVRRVETQELDGTSTLGVVALTVGGVVVAWLGLLALMASTEHT